MAPGDTDDRLRRERFEALVLRAYAPVLRYLRRRAPDLADDVLGETLLVMWRRLDDIPPDAELPWCFGVARGCLANAIRGQVRHRRLLTRLADEVLVATQDSSADPDLDRALRSLKTHDQEVLRLWAWEDLAPREIAVVLGISANAAGIRVHRAVRRLRAALERDGKSAHLAGHLKGDTTGPGRTNSEGRLRHDT